jgi:hypothetical protein
MSSNPTTPYVGSPHVVSTAILWISSLGEYAIAVTWDRPVGGYWDFSIVQGANTMLGYLVADSANFSYNPTTYTYTMPVLASAGLVAGSCALALEEPNWPGATTGWHDPYGAPAWTTPAQVYNTNLIVP